MDITIPTRESKILPALVVDTITCNDREYRIEWETNGGSALLTSSPTGDKPGIRVNVHGSLVAFQTFTVSEDGTQTFTTPITFTVSNSEDLDNENLKAVVDCAITYVQNTFSNAPDAPAPEEADLNNAF